MILAFDIGNTFVKWGFVHDGAVVGGGRAVHRGRGLEAALEQLQLQRSAQRIVAVNVAGEVAATAISNWATHHGGGSRVEFITSGTTAQRVRTAYKEPTKLGADRWAAIVGAFHTHGACLIADLGTATTLDFVDRDGLHRGGYIVPGIDSMRTALSVETQGVDVDDVELTPGAWGRDTAECVAGGTRRALASLIAAAAAEHAAGSVSLILTGGDADRVAPWLGMRHRIDHDLVLRGAVRLAEGNA